jgi:hypothetical protein
MLPPDRERRLQLARTEASGSGEIARSIAAVKISGRMTGRILDDDATNPPCVHHWRSRGSSAGRLPYREMIATTVASSSDPQPDVARRNRT